MVGQRELYAPPRHHYRQHHVPTTARKHGRLRQGSLARPRASFPRCAEKTCNRQKVAAQPFLNICLIPRRACRVRSSFSINEKRTCPSPCSPKPTPGLTATFASSSSRMENSTAPRLRYWSGILPHTNIVAFGSVTGHPTLFRPGTSASRLSL